MQRINRYKNPIIFLIAFSLTISWHLCLTLKKCIDFTLSYFVAVLLPLFSLLYKVQTSLQLNPPTISFILPFFFAQLLFMALRPLIKKILAHRSPTPYRARSNCPQSSFSIYAEHPLSDQLVIFCVDY